ncbi:hypothetical protein D3C80_1783250 [compost metagenome]
MSLLWSLANCSSEAWARLASCSSVDARRYARMNMMCLTYQLGCSTNTVALWVLLIKRKGQINLIMPVSAKAYPLLRRKGRTLNSCFGESDFPAQDETGARERARTAPKSLKWQSRIARKSERLSPITCEPSPEQSRAER